MTTLTADTGLQMIRTIQNPSPVEVEVVYESSSDVAIVAIAELLMDSEATRATLMKFRREGRSAFPSSVQEESSEEYITAEEYPALAEIWDNDADAVYDGM